MPETTLLLRYEDLRLDPIAGLTRIRDLFSLDLASRHLESAVEAATKENMAARISPLAERGEARVVRFDERDPSHWFSDRDIDLFRSIVEGNLRYSMGYDYAAWPSIFPMSRAEIDQ